MKAELFWIDGPWQGRLAVMPRPRGGDWLEDEIVSLNKMGISVLVSTLTEPEIAELDLKEEQRLCEEHNIQYISFPIEDRGVPHSSVTTSQLVHRLEHELTNGKNVAIHCRMGVGRSALVASSILVSAGIDPKHALDRIQTARGCAVPDTNEQRTWVQRFAKDILAPAVER